MLHELRVHQIELEMQSEELQRAQTERQTSHERFQDLYNFAPVGYYTVSEQGLILEINLTAAILFDVPKSQLIGNPLSRFILAEDQHIYYRHRKPLFTSGEQQKFELRLVRADTSLFWARFEGIAAKDGSGAATCRFALIDITEYKLAEEKVIAAQVYLEKIIDNIGDPVYVKDEQHRMTLVNDAFCSIFGLPWSKIIGKTLANDLPLDQAEHFMAIDRQVLTDRQENVCEGLLTVKGEKTVTVSTRKTQYVDENGDIFLIGVIHDISERKQIEEKIKENLLEKETLLREIHHRVKNNMVVISSLLSLQASGIKDDSMGMQLVTVFVRQLRGTLGFQANVTNGKGTKVIITFEEKDREHHHDSR